MEFRVKSEYTKDYLINVWKEEYKIFLVLIKVVAIIITLLSIFSFALALIGNNINNEDLVNILQVIFVWVAYFTLPLICASIQMVKIRKQEIDGMRVLSFDNQVLSVNYGKYNKIVCFPVSEIKKIREIGNYYKVLINKKWMYISLDDFELGNAKDFYNWIENRIGC